jgi:hypothetical protein
VKNRSLYAAQPFIIAEEEELVLDDGTADGEAELVLTKLALGDVAGVFKIVGASNISLRKNSQALP